jgi:hypothetical protein
MSNDNRFVINETCKIYMNENVKDEKIVEARCGTLPSWNQI